MNASESISKKAPQSLNKAMKRTVPLGCDAYAVKSEKKAGITQLLAAHNTLRP